MTRTDCFEPAKLKCVHAPILAAFLLLLNFSVLAQDPHPRMFSVQAAANVQESPPRITLNWPNEGDANSYTISRRTLDSGWQEIGTIGGGETSFGDGGVSIGTPYEYRIVKNTSRPYTGYGFLRVGIRVANVDSRGTVILLVEHSPAGALGGELDRLRRDLIADGWTVIRRDISMHDSPGSVREQIRSIYNSDPQNVKAVFLFGHIPVPYSGDIYPDGHLNHKGAWPADLFYGDVDGNWTDRSVNSVTAEREINRNTPGDGKYDQSEIPGNIELMVGRVDLHNLTSFANKSNSRSEIDLLRQYLNKHHAFRVGDIAVERRAIICDNFGDKGTDRIAGSAWRTFPGTVGRNIQEVPWDGYLPATTSGSYLWSYASGGGSYYYSTGVGSSDDFALKDVKVVFAMFMGSYFGDWNNESNFLRAALGSGYILASTYAGSPHTLFFPMGLGETIGHCIRMSQNNKPDGLYPPWGQGTHQVHISLHGDPTLRMHPVKPPGGVSVRGSGGQIGLSWGASPDGNLQGYHVYRATSADGPFTRLTQQPVGAASFTDAPPAGNYTYMIRAIKLEQSPSGTYLNPSLGVFASATSTGGGTPTPTPEPPAAPSLAADVVSHSQINLRWNDVSDETSYKIERRGGNSANWTEITTAGANATTFSDQGLTGATEYFYRMRALNSAGASPYSGEVRLVTQAPPQPSSTVTFVELHSGTAGNWPQKFGREGAAIAGRAANLPFAVNLNGAATHTWAGGTEDQRALLNAAASTSRSAVAWYGDTLTVDIAAGDTTRRLAFYMVDWDGAGRGQDVTIRDAATGVVMDSRTIRDFGDGVYLVYDMRGNIQLKLTKTAGPNAVLQGIFAGGAVPPPVSDNPLLLRVRSAANNAIIVTISGDSGQRYRLEASSDLRAWSEVTTGAMVSSSSEVQVPRTQSHLYLRTVNTR